MRVIVAVLALLTVGLGVSISHPEAAHACSGRRLDLKDALRMSHGAVYAGRIERAEPRPGSFRGYDITIDVEIVVRGPAAPRLRRADAGAVCDPIMAGTWGYIVRDVRDPEYPGVIDDLFFRVSRYYGRNAVRAVGLPDTAATPATRDDSLAVVPLGWLAVSSAVGFAVAYRRVRRPRTD